MSVNQETHPEYNAEPGIAIVPGSNYAKHMQQFEQFPGKYGNNPGNPYTYRPFPKMLYRAEEYNGAVRCMAAPPDSYEFKDDREYDRARQSAEKFTARCQRIVQDEREMQKAMEDNWRESPDEAVKALEARRRAHSDAEAERAYADRNMSEAAKREIAAAAAETDGHLAEVKEAPRARRK